MSTQGSTLADILERVLDKGIVIAGDISVSVGSTELLNIRIRLLISSVDKAREIGINWWESDPYLSSQARTLTETNQQLQERIQSLEAQVRELHALATPPTPAVLPHGGAELPPST
nr:gas vesicle protein [Neosynechococcus sphagnicola]